MSRERRKGKKMKRMILAATQPPTKSRIEIERGGEDVVFGPELKALLESSEQPQARNGDGTREQTETARPVTPYAHD